MDHSCSLLKSRAITQVFSLCSPHMVKAPRQKKGDGRNQGGKLTAGDLEHPMALLLMFLDPRPMKLSKGMISQGARHIFSEMKRPIPKSARR